MPASGSALPRPPDTEETCDVYAHLDPCPEARRLSALALFTALSIFVAPAHAQRKERQGKDVVDAVCSACHLSGKDNAPRIGDAKAWSRGPRGA
jgi:cytochrome c5